MNVKSVTTTRVAPDWELSVRRVDNGFIVTSYEEMHGSDDENPIYKKSEFVFEDGAFFDEIESLSILHRPYVENDQIAMYFLLHHIGDHFGCHYDKHSKVNLYVDFVVNEEVEDGLEGE